MRVPFSKKMLVSAIIGATVLAVAAPASAGKRGHGHQSDSELVIYFTRHAEKQTVTVGTGKTQTYTSSLDADGDAVFELIDTAANGTGSSLNEVCGSSNCAEELSGEGEVRALLLADWFAKKGVVRKLDGVYATHKTRTQQTVMPTATAAGLPVIILNPGDSELSPESTGQSRCSSLQAIETARTEGLDTILIAGHSGTLYDIMGDTVTNCVGADGTALTGLGLDISDNNRFPKDADGKVRDFGDIWKVSVDDEGQSSFEYRVNLQPARLGVVNIAR